MSDTSSEREISHLARGGAINLVGSLINAVGNFVVVVLIIRALGADRAGAFLEATAIYNMATTAGQLGADTGLARFLPRAITLGHRDQLRGWTRIALVPVVLLGLFLGALVFGLAQPLSELVAEGASAVDFQHVVRVFAPFFALGAVYLVLQTGTRAFGTMVPAVAVERIGRPAAQTVAVLAVVATNGGPVALALAWVVPLAVATLPLGTWYAVLLRQAERGELHAAARPSGSGLRYAGTDALATGDPSEPARARAFWHFAAPRALAGVFQVAVLWLDVLLVGALSTSKEAGIYSASSRWLVLGLFVSLAVNQAIQPQLSRLLAEENNDEAAAVFKQGTAWVIALVWPVYLTVATFGGVLVTIFGSGFQQGSSVLLVLGLAGLLASGSGPVDMVLLMAGRSSLSLWNTAAALVVNVVANIVLVPRIGVVGAAVAWGLSLAVANLLPLWQVWRLLGMHPFGPAWRRLALAAVLAAGLPLLISRLVLGATVWGLVAGVAVGGACYVATLFRMPDALQPAALRAALQGRRRGTAATPGRRAR